MSFKLRCYTLFDVTQTGITNRGKPSDDSAMAEWVYKRNTQCNLDTILQVISLRSQPDLDTRPKLIKINLKEFDKFGFLFEQLPDEFCNCWYFDFSIQHASVFNDGISDLGALLSDCDRVPMIKCGTEWEKLPSFLDTSEALKNINFEVISDD